MNRNFGGDSDLLKFKTIKVAKFTSTINVCLLYLLPMSKFLTENIF